MKSTIDTGSQWMMLRQISKHDTSVLHPAVKAEAPTAAPTSSYDSYPTSRGDSHPTAEAGATTRPIEIKTWATCQVEALAKTTQVSTDTLTDSDDAHLTVQLLYQPFTTKPQDTDGYYHNDSTDAQQSAHTFAPLDGEPTTSAKKDHHRPNHYRLHYLL